MDFCRLRIDNREEWCLLEESSALVISGAPWSSWEMTGEKVDLFGRRFLFPAAPKTLSVLGRTTGATSRKGSPIPKSPYSFGRVSGRWLLMRM